MIKKSLKITAMTLALMCAGTSASAEPDLLCESGSGIWNTAAQTLELDGVLCANSSNVHDFYRLNFIAQTGKFAPSIPNINGELRYLFASPQVIFYADDSTVYALEREHFRVIWHMPWQNAKRLPVDTLDAGHFALWSKTDSGSEIHLLRAGTTITEEMSAQLGAEPPLQVEWQEKRLVIIEKDKLTYWPRPGIPLPTDPADPTSQPVTPDSWKYPPFVVSLDPELTEGMYELDPNGLMLLNRPAKKLTYYRFNNHSWIPARINATASIHALGHGTKYAMAVTIDMNTVRVVARLGMFLQNRFEAKYWKLPSASDNITVIGQDDIAALDGGSDNRVQTFDITEMTWKRLALIDFSSPGRISELLNDELITIHPTDSAAINIWNARTGAKISSISAEKLTALNFGPVKSVQSIPNLKRYKLITSQTEQFVIYDAANDTLSTPLPFVKVPWSSLPEAIEILPEAMIVHSDSTAPGQWDIYPADASKAVEHKSIESFKTPSSFGELQSAKEKWYGYCLNNDDCFTPAIDAPIQPRKSPSFVSQDAPPSHAPSPLSWILCALALFAMFAVMLWRHGFGRKSLLVATPVNDEDGLAQTDIFDSKNRRYITDRDDRFFLAPHIFSRPIFRVLLSTLLGPAIGIAVAAPFFYDDTFLTFLSWVLVMGMPISAVTWIATSWTYWNRYYLLRFGSLTEGKWLNCAQTNPSIVYEPVAGKTYELSKRQWSRVDFVPMVLFDPARPNFAIQYTGIVTHTSEQHGDLKAPPKAACAFDAFRLAIVLFLLAGTLILTQFLFHHAYPNPLSAWKLASIARDVPPDTEDLTFTTACLSECNEEDSACYAQCHQRQLRLILEEAGVAMEYDPITTSREFLDSYRQEIAKAREIALEHTELSCSEREEQLAAISLWPDEINNAFWRIYANSSTFDSAGLEEIYQAMTNDAHTLKALCDSDTSCAHSGKTCPEPPTCPGSITALKNRICALQNALVIPNIHENGFDMDVVEEKMEE
ncbi:MAG: hypothetical protein IJU23_04265, partial [Proteobacteria bacterium]|nr:hypothetical protein [Pseudomonadota bacterium]